MPGTDFDIAFGRALAEERKRQNLTVRQLAERTGWADHTRITGYETGKRTVTVEALLTLADALGRHPAWFLVQSDEEREVVGAVAGNRERAQQVRYMLAMLAAPEPSPPE